MAPTLAPHAAHIAPFLSLYTTPDCARTLGASEWDMIVRMGWAAGLLGTLADRIDDAGCTDDVPTEIRRHFTAIRTLVRYRHQMTRVELDNVAKVLAPLDVPVVIAKGAAYVMQGLSHGRSRLFADVDIIVPRARLDEVERALVDAEWFSDTLDPYDQHYYRAWAHELPPMRHRDYRLELDVHHTILPLTGRVQPNAAALFENARRLPDSSLSVLCAEDQLLHACAHLFQDSDLSDRLRELVDIDGLVRAYSGTAGFWTRLVERARLHQLGRPLWYGLRYAAAWLGTHVPVEAFEALHRDRPNSALTTWMDHLVTAALPPADPDRLPGRGVRATRLALYVRSLWLRMPPWQLARHLATKGLRRVAPARDADAQQQAVM